MNTATLLPSMETFLDAVYDDVRRARERVMVECYIVRGDKLGRELGDLLAGAAARGVRTRLLYDPFGSLKTAPEFFAGLRARGVEAEPYRRKVPRFGSLSLATRDHARSIVVDGAGYTGGQAWGDEWLPLARGGHGWYDVSVRLTGPIVDDVARHFEQRWAERMGVPPRDFDSGDRHPDVRLVSDSPSRESLVFNVHVDRFRAARRRIWLANAYFYPPLRMLDALAEAAARGVDVRIIVPGASDLALIARSTRAEYLDWLAAGLKLFEYQPALMHCKYALVDDDWCTVGSFNANATSVLWAVEMNLFFRSPAFVAEVAAHFARDEHASAPVEAEAVRRRPFVEREVDHLYRFAMGATNVLLGPRRKPRATPRPR